MEELEEHECATCNKRFYLDEASTPDKCPSCEWDEYEKKNNRRSN